MAQTLEEAVLKVVMWWSEKSFSIKKNQNNGDQSTKQGENVYILMNQLSRGAQLKITPSQVKIFEDTLTDSLMSAHKSKRDVSVDYTPDEHLSNACEVAGIDPVCLPCKSHTIIDGYNEAYGKFQYGNPIQKL